MAIEISRLLTARWPDAKPAHVALLRKAGIEAVVVPGTPDAAFAGAAAAAGIAVIPETELTGTVTRGIWPGIRRPGRRVDWETDVIASPSTEPWIDSNAYVVPFERTLTGNPRPVLAYRAAPDAGLAADRSVPFETLEVALIEARLPGGNYILSIDPRYRAALLADDARALAAWSSLGKTAAWLRQNEALFGQPTPPTLTALVEPGAATAELANLLYRRNGSPRLAPASSPPAPDPKQIRVLVAASLRTVPDVVWRHADAGSTVVIDNAALTKPAWRRVKQEPDRDFFATGAGSVVVYRKRVADPSEFALDMIDLVGHQHREARVWNATSSVTFSTAGAASRPDEALLHIINYGANRDEEVQARIQGHFSRATLLRPETPPLKLETKRRGPATEVFLPNLRRVAVVRFEGRA